MNQLINYQSINNQSVNQSINYSTNQLIINPPTGIILALGPI